MITRIRSWPGITLSGQTASRAYILKWQNGGNRSGGRYRSRYVFPLVKDRLNWNTNATWMITSEKDTGNPLSVIPKYTINNSLNWTITGRFLPASTGRYMANKNRILMRKPAVKILAVCQVKLGAYSLGGDELHYDINKICVLMSASVISSINQIFGIFEGANTYNEQAGLIMPELPHHSDRSVSGALPA